MNALIYTRVSQDKSGEGRSVDEQEAECRRYCQAQGWTVVDVLVDQARSASRYAKKERPAWAAVKQRVASGEVGVLVTWEASRNARDLGAFVELRDLCRRHGTLLAYSGRVLDLAGSADAFTAGLEALLSEREADVTSERIRRATRAQAEKGRPHGRRLFGYSRVYDEHTGVLRAQVPHPDEAPIVAEVFGRIAAGESSYRIADDLNGRGVPTPTGTPWSLTRVKRMTQNPAYIAVRVHQGREVGDADWPALVDRAVFDQAAARWADVSRRKYRGSRTVRHLLSGIARCGVCGAGLHVGEDRGRPNYTCRPGRGHLARTQAHLDAFVTAAVLDRLATLDLDAVTGDDPDAAAARAEARTLRERLDAAVDRFTAGELSATTLARVEADLLPKITAAEQAATPSRLPDAVRDLAGQAEVDAAWDRLDVQERRAVIRLLADVTVEKSTRPRGSRGFDPDAVRIAWRV